MGLLPTIGMKNLSSPVILSERSESKDPYTTYSLTPGTFLGGRVEGCL